MRYPMTGNVLILYSFITLLVRLLLNTSSTFDSEHTFSRFASSMVDDILVPNLVWKAGRVNI